MKKYNYKEIWLSGPEIFWLITKKEKKILIGESDGNPIQRNFNSWEKERTQEYVRSIESNFPHNPIYILDFQDKWYVVDGQHRLNAIKKIIDEKNVFQKTLFKFIIIKSDSENLEAFISEGETIFYILNNTADKVISGAICKTKFRSISNDKTDELINIYEETFKCRKNPKTNEVKTDEVFQIIATALFSMEKGSKDLYTVGKMNDEIIEFLIEKLNVELIEKMIKMLNLFKENKIYCNRNNSENAQPTKNVLIPLLISINEKGIQHAKIFKDKIHTLYESHVWLESKRNTRTPQSLSMAAIAIIEAESPGELVDAFRKQNSGK